MVSSLSPSSVSCLFRPLVSADPRVSYLRFERQKVKIGRGLKATGLKEARVSVEEKREGAVKKPIVVIDNYDSFTYNLCQYVGETGADFEVYRNDELTVEELKRKNPSGILISPGPGTPTDSGISLQTVLELGPCIPLFGVCMGLQCIGEAFGGKIIRAPSGVMHGKEGIVYYDENSNDNILDGLPNPFVAGRYHSLVIENESFPSDLEITAWTKDGLIMAARHKKHKHIQVIAQLPICAYPVLRKQSIKNATETKCICGKIVFRRNLRMVGVVRARTPTECVRIKFGCTGNLSPFLNAHSPLFALQHPPNYIQHQFQRINNIS